MYVTKNKSPNKFRCENWQLSADTLTPPEDENMSVLF